MNNRHIYILAGVLAAVGLLITLAKVSVIGLPLTPGAMADAWMVERQIEFEADGGPVKLQIKMPSSTFDKAILREQIIANGYGTTRSREGDNRILTLATREASGLQAIFHRAGIERLNTITELSPSPRPVFRTPLLDERQRSAINELLGIAVQRSADDVTLISAVINLMDVSVLSDNLSAITDGEAGLQSKADAAVAILATRGLAARRVNGVDLSRNSGSTDVVHWLEVYLGEFWRPFSLTTGAPQVPDSYMPIWRGDESMVQLEGGQLVDQKITLKRIKQRVLDQVRAGQTPRQALVNQFSLSSLPLATQEVYRIMLVVPVGIFLLVLLRNVIGVKSLGTFMPVLIALALHRTYLLWGIVLFVGIVTAGLLFRLYLEHLKLLLVPRLAAVLIFVIMLMTVLSIFTHSLGFAHGLSVALFPMVIMTMTIERLSVLWDERGAAEAIKQGTNSMIVALLICLAMAFPIFSHLFFTFPELLLVVLALTLLLGRYTGYRLLELPRFRALSEPTVSKGS